MDTINAVTIYSEVVREFVIFTKLISFVYDFGYTNTMDSMIINFKNEYPNSEYLDQITKIENKFNSLSEEKDAPDFDFTTTQGNSITLESLKGKVVFIDVWATWCAPCRKGHPHVAKLIEQFKNDPIVFLFISHDKDEKKHKEYLYQHPELKGIHIREMNKSFMDAYKITGIPRYIIINKDGKMFDAFARSPEKEIEPILERLLR